MPWGISLRPVISNKLGSPVKEAGSDGDIQIRQTNIGPKIFGKLGGTWYGASLTSTVGDPVTRFGVKNSDHLAISKDGIEIHSGGVKAASFGKDIALAADGTVTIGKVAASKSNIYITAGAIQLRTNTTAQITLDTSGDITLPGSIINSDTGSNNFIFTNLPPTGGGNHNIIIGNRSGTTAQTSDTGYFNALVGYRAGEQLGGGGASTSGSYSVCIGYEAGLKIGEGQFNTCVGAQAGDHITTGSYNISLGRGAGDAISTGQANVSIGYLADGAAGVNEQIAIGNQVVCDTQQTLRIGDSTAYLFFDFSGSGGAVTVTSDERVKKNIVDTDIGLSFINSLRPIKYVSKNKQVYPDELFQDGINPLKDKTRGSDPTGIVDGFIGQEVKEVMDDLDVTFSGWRENNSSRQMLSYSIFVVPLTKAVQELSAKIDTMQTEINNLKEA